MQLILKKKSILLIFLVLGIALENFKLINVAGAPIKVTHLVFMVAILNSICLRMKNEQFDLKKLTMLLFLLVIPLFPWYRISETLEFFKTYMIYCIMISFMILSYKDYSKKFNEAYKNYISLFLWVVLFVQVLGIIQFICMNYFNYFFLDGFWGMFQFHASIYGMQNGLYRAYSIFHEPSLFGWTTTTSFAICIYLKRKSYFAKSTKYYLFQLFNVLAVGVSVSASALVILLSILGLSMLMEIKKTLKFIVSTVIACLIITALWNYTTVFYSLQRIEREINTSDTSGYERLVTPTQYMTATFNHYPLFGRGLGQEGDVDAVGIIGLYQGVHNSLFGIFVNLGLSAILFVIYFFGFFWRKIKYDKDYIFLIIALVGIYISTGAYISLDTFVMLVFTLFIGDLYTKISTQKNKSSSNNITSSQLLTS